MSPCPHLEMMAVAAAALGNLVGLAGCRHLPLWSGTAQAAGIVQPLFCSMSPRALSSTQLAPRLWPSWVPLPI